MTIRVGIGGWNYAPWRGAFYPEDLPQRRELEYASGRMTAIEINATYYGTQKPASFARWRDETPEGFKFSLKASRFATNRRVLAEAGESITRFVSSGITELGDKLGPIVWQFAPTKQFDPVDFGAFLQQLPDRQDGHALHHVLDVRNDTFMCREFIEMARKHEMAAVFTDSPGFPSFADRTAGLVYARLMNADLRYKDGYAPKALDQWAARTRQWATGVVAPDLPRVLSDDIAVLPPPADVFIYFINGAKERAPAAAAAFQRRL